MASKLSPDFYIDRTNERWQLVVKNKPEFKPFSVNFHSGSYLNIYKKGLSKRDPLAKAIGAKSGTLKILDLTAGWLKDTWMLLQLGHSVTACEKNQLVYDILSNAVSIDRNIKEYSNLFEHLNLVHQDSLTFIQSNDLSHWDVAYLDPMFPKNSKTALAGKEMQILQLLVGNETENQDILTQLLQSSIKRIVVKRPLKGPELLSGVNFKVESKASRFDVYLN
ncbi:MAG: class I SAM-dependent methyltransferase [Bdellovibrionales bacterium]|nr:class I SAM-dependent methyltransferase [Bdellovibrionales bacterium]